MQGSKQPSLFASVIVVHQLSLDVAGCCFDPFSFHKAFVLRVGLLSLKVVCGRYRRNSSKDGLRGPRLSVIAVLIGGLGTVYILYVPVGLYEVTSCRRADSIDSQGGLYTSTSALGK